MTMTMKDLEIGKTAVVCTVGGEGALRQHFLDMGVIPGAEVTVGVQGEARAVVAQHTGQGLYIHAAGDRHCGECVSEVVETYMLLNARLGQQLSVDPRHGIRTPVAACPGRWEQDGVIEVLLVLLYQ